MKVLGLLLSITLTSSYMPELLKYKNINNLIIFNCISVHENILLQSEYFRDNIKILTPDFYYNFPNEKSLNKIGVFVNSSCPEWQDILASTHSTFAFKKTFSWFIISSDLNNTTNILSDYPIDIDSDLTIILEHQNNNITDFYEMYNSGFYNNGSWFIQKIGSWDTSGLKINTKLRNNMTGVSLKCMSVITQDRINETVSHYVEISKIMRGADTLNKLKFFTLLKYLRDMYDYRYIIKRTKSWGYPHNGSFDGMVGALQRKEIDLGCSPIFLWSERARVIDYTMQTWQSRQAFVFRHPKRLGAYYTIFTRPLSNEVWSSMVALLCLSGALLCVLLRARTLRLPGDEPDSSAGLGLLAIWSAVCQQGMPLNRGSFTVNLVVFSTFIFSLTMYQYYNASVVSSLLRESPKNIRTLDDLLVSDLKAGIENYPFTLDYFRRTTHSTALQLYNEKIVTKTERNVFDLHSGMARVKKGGFAFHVDLANGYCYMKLYFDEKAICEAQEVQLFPPMNMVSAVKQGSPYRELITYGLRRMFEVGIFNRIRSEWDVSRPECPHTPDATIFTVSIYEVSTPFIILALAVPLSIVILLCEIVMYKVSFRGRQLDIKFVR